MMDGKVICFLLKNRWVDFTYLEQRKRDYTYSKTVVANWWSVNHLWSVTSKRLATAALENVYLQENYKNTLILIYGI